MILELKYTDLHLRINKVVQSRHCPIGDILVIGDTFKITSPKLRSFTVTEKSAETAQETEVQVEVKDEKKESDEFDLSDITAQPKELSREEIIAAAEAAAFGND